MLAAVRQVMERLKTDSNLQEPILNCIDSAIAERANIINGTFNNALDSQSKIGWIDMIRGYWSSSWQIAYEQLYSVPLDEDRKAKNKRSLHMQRWQKKLIQTIWHSMIQLWKLRNDKRHGWDAKSSTQTIINHWVPSFYQGVLHSVTSSTSSKAIHSDTFEAAVITEGLHKIFTMKLDLCRLTDVME
jgi:hypothetical protein